MTTQTDSRGHVYVDVENIRISYIPAADCEEAANWSGTDVIRVQSYKGDADRSLHMGAEFPVPSSEVFGQVVAGICQVYADGK